MPKNLGGLRPPQEVVPALLKRGPRAETGGIFVPRVFALMTDHEGEGSGVEDKLLGRQSLVLFARKKGMASRSHSKICFWSNDVNRPVVGGNCLVHVRN